MIELSLNNVGKFYGANKVLEDITFEAKTGEKIAIVGRNGTGKTTIFKIIAGIEDYNGGVLSIRKGASVGYLDQIPDYPDHYKVNDVLNLAFEKQYEIKEQMRELENQMSCTDAEKLDSIMNKYGKLQNMFEHMGGYEIEERISKICTGLKISEEFKNRAFNNLSGGEKTTVILGKILLQNPDILLLDEPSNHLDIDSVEWLEEFLNEYKGTSLIISHDRYFLDKVVTKIVEVEDKATSIYLGNYTYYVAEKKRRLDEQFKLYQNQQKKIKAMEDAIKRFRDWGTRADNEDMFVKARSMQKRIDKMDKVDKPIMERKKIQLDFNIQDRSGKEVINVERLKKAFGDNLILEDLDLHVKYGEKVVILGKNGCGKSTLLKILLNEYEADEGNVKIGSRVKIGYLDQNIHFENQEQTVLEAFREKFNIPIGEARGILARFLFYSEDVYKKVSTLSGGEKSRLKLCQLMYQDINLLILDEPTNHLDIDSREMLEESLSEFKGTILFISHDRYFINKIAERVTEIKNRKLVSYSGNYDYYRRKKEEELLKNEKLEQSKKEKKNKVRKDISKKSTDNNKAQAKAIEKLEQEIENIEELINNKNIEMEKNACDHEKLSEIYNEKEKLEEKLNQLMEEWAEYNC